MFISLLAALERSTGKTTILASAGSVAAGGDCSKVTAQYAKFLAGDDAGNKLRAKYSAILLIQDNMVRNQHTFPDVEKVRKTAQEQADRAAAIDAVSAAEAQHADMMRKAEEARRELEQARNRASAAGIKTPAVNQAAAEAAAKEAADKAAAEEAAKKAAEESDTK